MRKVWIDCESTGLDPSRHTVIQIAALCEGDEFHAKIHPQPGTEISAGAMMVNSFLHDEAVRQDPRTVGIDFLKFLKKHRDLNKGYRLLFSGHNVQFDISFLKAWYARMQVTGFEEIGDYHYCDSMHLAIALKDKGLLPLNQKLNLSALCERFGVKNETAHDALSDIKATRELYHKMLGKL
jgi:DNA polymerase III epsilon subunit-like protein